MQELFDIPEQYDAMLEKGIAATGNTKDFFIHGRLDHVQKVSPGLEEIKSILDYGCGTGQTSFELAGRFPKAKITGADLSEKAIQYANRCFERENLEFVSLGDLSSKTFDLVYLNGVIHHIKPNERESVFSDLYRSTADGGLIWIFENNPANPGTQWAMYANPFDKGVKKVWPSELSRSLRKAGFSVLQTDFLFYFPQWLSFLRPLEKGLIRFPLGGQYGTLARKPRP